MKRELRILLVGVLIFMGQIEATAQCAMCRAVIESNTAENGAEISAGINNGILYLMGFPYLLIFAFLAYVFKDQLKAKLFKAWLFHQ